ncbi:MAG: EamA/RhaT family transporter [Varibaculum sp.]|nr:EamA/RhaT family transporter [Varibaculum sp.]
MQQNIPLAILLQIIGSFCFALSAYKQNKAVRRQVRTNDGKRRLTSTQLWNSMRTPRWWQGTAFMGISLGCQVTALFFAPVTVVQPVGLMAFPWSILLQARAAHRHIPKRIHALVSMTVAATAVFTLLVSVFASPESELQVSRVIIGAAVIYVVAAGFGTYGARGARAWRSLFWASGGAMFYGLEAALTKSLITFARQHEWATDPMFWLILVCLIVGSVTAGWMVQQGYATGPADMVVASMTITSPVVAVVYGIAVLGEGQSFTPGVGVAVVALGLIAVSGVIALTRLKANERPIVT